ncbi:hypothetical protein ACHAW6_012298 [Cyclotella cf. meneghiniana]
MKLSRRTTACLATMMAWQHVSAGTSITTAQHTYNLSFTLECATTCDQSLCTCISSANDPISCANQLHSVCTSGGIDDCVPPSGINQFRSLHCPYAACIVDGGSREECACDFFRSSCEIFGEEETMGYCVIADCCKGQSDDAWIGECFENGMLEASGVHAPTSMPAVSKDQTNGSLTQNSFILEDFMLLDDDASEFSSENPVTWILPPSVSPTSALIADGSPSFIDSTFTLSLGFARFCSSTCDQSLCSCLIEKNDFSLCISELYSSCTDDTISQCVPDIMAPDFKQVYCPYSECVELGSMEGKTPEQCSCERYDGLCGLNGDDESCSISRCCSEQQTDEGKLTCLGFTSALIEEPPASLTSNPTSNPTSIPITNSPISRRPTTVPTSAPSTDQPSPRPSNGPSNSPTMLPVTKNPSNRPTSKPSEQPTAAPISRPPTKGPSGSPSNPPTMSPVTKKPTNRPTSKPSEQPTKSPSGSPSNAPTMSPVTDKPSNRPTSKPSEQPTEGPSRSPSNKPTLSPVTDKPSNGPTSKPSVIPTEAPATVDPSQTPTDSPSRAPMVSPITFKPTERPSSKPSTPPTVTTKVPSQGPSDNPSLNPTVSPVTYKPTKMPTQKPVTPAPSRSPTGEPSQSLTYNPSSSPTTSPTTANPTNRPTPTPSIPPTAEPTTIDPSRSPSDIPSSQATTSPVTDKPTRIPTSKPVTAGPTLNPSKSPTRLPTRPPVTNDPTKQPSPPTTAPVSATDSPTGSKDFGEKVPVYCPPAYDPLWASSYAAGDQVEVDGIIYECNQYPYSIYCSLMDYRPVHGNEYWEDAWAKISPCDFTDDHTASPTASPTTKEPTRQPTNQPSTMSPSISPSTNKPTKRPTMLPTNSPTTNPPTKERTTSPSSNPTEPPSHSPTKAPTLSPRVEVTSLVQFEMQTMTKIMNDYEVYGVFQPSCKNFLKMQLINEEPRVFDINCKVTNQQLLSQRMLIDSSLRRLDESTSLLVDVEATGLVLPSENVKSASDVNFDALINDAFAKSSEIFINSLKNKGDVAGIDTFDELYSVTSIEQVNDKSAISEGSASNTEGVNIGALVAILVGAVAIVVLFGALIYILMNRAVDDDSFTDDGELDGVMGDLGITGFQSTPVNRDYPNVLSEDSANKNDNLTYAFSLENGIDSPNSIVSASKLAWESGAPARVRRVVVAPPGKLGIIIDTSTKGPIVHSVKDESVLEGSVFAGDLIIALDDEDTSNWSAHHLTKLVAAKSKCERKITVLSMFDS